jgi:hypothetical protein
VEAGQRVVLMDSSEDGLKRGMDLIQANYSRSVSRGSRTQASAEDALSRIKGTLAYVCFVVGSSAAEELSFRLRPQTDPILRYLTVRYLTVSASSMNTSINTNIYIYIYHM